METLILAARVGLSLAAVLGLMWWLSRRMQSSATLRRRRREGLIVLGRQQLGGKAGVALIEANGHTLVVGYGEHGVTLIHDGGKADDAGAGRDDASEPAAPQLSVAEETSPVATVRTLAPVHTRSTSARTAAALRPRTPLEGSILAPDTWRKAVVAAQEWTTRRS